MLDITTRQLFKKWKLYEKEWAFYTTLCYESPVIRVERIFDKTQKNKVHDFVLDLFFNYEYHGQKVTTRDIWALTWLDHSTVVKLTKRALKRAKEEAMLLHKQNISPNDDLWI